jgi:hypothetical protein
LARKNAGERGLNLRQGTEVVYISVSKYLPMANSFISELDGDK